MAVGDGFLKPNSLTLLNRKRMVGRLELDSRPKSTFARMDVALQISSLEIAGQAVGEPAKHRPERRSIIAVEDMHVTSEAFAAQRAPDTEVERAVPVYQRELENAPNEKVMVLPNASVRRKFELFRFFLLACAKKYVGCVK